MGKDNKGKQDGTGPHKDSYEAKQGNVGKKAGKQKGDCK